MARRRISDMGKPVLFDILVSWMCWGVVTIKCNRTPFILRLGTGLWRSDDVDRTTVTVGYERYPERVLVPYFLGLHFSLRKCHYKYRIVLGSSNHQRQILRIVLNKKPRNLQTNLVVS